jgi:hypothetical protein
MTDHPDTLARFRLPLRRDQMKQAREFAAPATRFATKNPLLLIGAGVLAVAGIVIWANREKIGAKAGPLLEEAKAKGLELMDEARTRSATLIDEAKTRSQTLIDEAALKGQDLLAAAKTKGEEVAEKVATARRRNATPSIPTDIH